MRVAVAAFVAVLAFAASPSHGVLTARGNDVDANFSFVDSLASARRLASGGATRELVTITVNDTMNATGWIAMRIERANGPVDTTTTSAEEEEDAVWYAAGRAEGAATAHRIDDIYSSAMVPQLPIDPRVTAFVEAHVAFMHATSAQLKNNSAFWATVHRVLLQVQGIADGYAAAYADAKGAGFANNLTSWDVFLLNYNYELMDVQAKFGITTGGITTRTGKKIQGGGCSAFVKSTGDDLLMGHTSWTGYNMMLKAWKDYDFASGGGGSRLPRRRVQMSSVPGTVASGDDWYQLSPAALLVTETTHYNYNQQLYDDFLIPETVSEFIRVMVANHLANSGVEWVNAFGRFNSGTYNNAYTIVDLKLFVPGTPTASLPDNLVWLTEQLPGMSPSMDVTPVMRRQGYWASYNRPFIPVVYNASGFRRMCAAYGALFCYENYPRATIFRRNASDVTDQKSFQDLIRYNNFLHDPLSVCVTCSDPPQNPWLAIAARGDLTPATQHQGNWSAFLGGPSADGGIDAKVGSYRMYHAGRGASIIAGPTHVQQPVFVWSASVVEGQVPHTGQPDRFDFEWVNPTADLLR